MSALRTESPSTPLLDRTINLTAVGWTAIGWVAVILGAAVLRLAQLGHFPLSDREARIAHEAYRFVTGATSGAGNEFTDVGPTTRLLTALSLFLFGDSDGAARFLPALLGIGMVAALLGLRRHAGRAQALGMAAFAMLSPTLVYASRTLSEEIVVAAFALFAAVAFLGVGTAPGANARTWRAVAAGAALAAAFGGGRSSLSVIIPVAAAAAVSTVLDPRPDAAFRRASRALREDRGATLGLLVGFVVTLVALFSRLFSDFTALAGIGRTFSDWGRLLTTASSNTPTQFFLLAILLYEFLAVAFAIVAATRTSTADDDPPLSWTFFAIWFAIALLVFSFSSGAQPAHAIHVALPIVLLGGGAAGEVVGRFARGSYDRGRLALLALAMLGFVIAVFSALVLIGRISDAIDQTQAMFEAGATIVLAVGPLLFAVVTMARTEARDGRPGSAGVAALLALLVLFGGITLRSSVLLSFYNAVQPVELLAQETSTPAVDRIVHRITNLGRDTTLKEGSARDPEGGHELTIALDQRVQYPYRWYLRDFPEVTVVPPGQGPVSGSQVVIAPDDEGMSGAGYTVTPFPARNRVPAAYSAPNFGDVLRGILFPSRWEQSARYLLFREMKDSAEPETVSVGLIGELANQVTVNTGPFGLFERVGAGDGRGQFNQPRGIAVDPGTGDVLVVDMGNDRVQKFDQAGVVTEVWGGPDGTQLDLAKTPEGLGPTGIAVGDDGLIYVCDTWNHRIVVLDQGGRLIRSFGEFGNTQDSPDPSVETGKFFGPRGIAVYNGEIYVVDTGNERVQVFAPDGTFLRAWGGHGVEPNHFVEPVGIAIDGDGRVYVADSSNARISIFTTAGTPLAQWPVDAWAGNLYFEPYLAFDQSGLLYATSSATGSVEVFNRNGAPIDSVTQVGSERLEQPTGIAASPDGSLLITDKAKSAVYRYVPPVRDASQIGDGSSLGAPSGDTGNSSAAATPASPAASPAAPSVRVVEPAASPSSAAATPPAASPAPGSPSVSSPVPASPSPLASSPTAAASPPLAASPSPATASPEASTVAVFVGSPAASPQASPVASPVASPRASPTP